MRRPSRGGSGKRRPPTDASLGRLTRGREEVAWRRGDYAAAVVDYNDAIKRDPANLDAQAGLTKAGEAYKAHKAEQEQLDRVQMAFAGAGVHVRAPHAVPAARDRRTRPRLDRYKANGWYNLGVVALRAGECQQARAHFGEALGMQPGDEDAKRLKAFAEKHDDVPKDRAFYDQVEALSFRGIGRLSEAPGQCRKWRRPTKTIAIPCSSAAAITSSSRIDPPGCDDRGDPGLRGDVDAVAEREEGIRRHRRAARAARGPSGSRSGPSPRGSSGRRRSRACCVGGRVDDRVRLHVPATRARRTASALHSVVGGARGASRPGSRGRNRRRPSQSWASTPPADPPQVEALAAARARGRRSRGRAASSSCARTARASAVDLGRDDPLVERLRDGGAPRRRRRRSAKAMTPPNALDGIALERLAERDGRARRRAPTPQGFPCFTMTQPRRARARPRARAPRRSRGCC